MARTSKDEWEADDELQEFIMEFPYPFSKYWYLGREGEARLKGARQAQEASTSLASQSSSINGAASGGVARVIFVDDNTPKKQTSTRSVAWSFVHTTHQGEEESAFQ